MATEEFNYRQTEFSASEELWENIGKIFRDNQDRDHEKSILETEEKLGWENENHLLAMLIVESFNDTESLLLPAEDSERKFLLYYGEKFRRLAAGFFKALRHRLFDITISLSILLLLAGLIVWSVRTVLYFSAPQLVVKRQGSLPAFSRINPGDLEIEERLNSGQNFSDPDKALNRYTLKELKNGMILTESDLLPAEFSEQMTGSRILFIPVRIASLNSMIKPVTKIGLLFASKKHSQVSSIFVEDVLLLKIEKSENEAILVVAIKSEQIENVKNIMGNSDVFVLQK